jgi:hypothetical protein
MLFGDQEIVKTGCDPMFRKDDGNVSSDHVLMRRGDDRRLCEHTFLKIGDEVRLFSYYYS